MGIVTKLEKTATFHKVKCIKEILDIADPGERLEMMVEYLGKKRFWHNNHNQELAARAARVLEGKPVDTGEEL